MCSNPTIYTANDCPNPYFKKLSALEIWDFDKTKQETAKSKGYQIMIIWDSEYRQNENLALQKCIDFIKGE